MVVSATELIVNIYPTNIQSVAKYNIYNLIKNITFITTYCTSYRRRQCKTSYVHETKFYRRDKKRTGIVLIHIYLLIFKYRSLSQLPISVLQKLLLNFSWMLC